jgi:hypothetical protein
LAALEARLSVVDDARPAAPAAVDITVAAAGAVLDIMTVPAAAVAEDHRSSNRALSVSKCTEAGKATRVAVT